MRPKKKTKFKLKFLRAVQFPRFTMREGECWDCFKEWGTGKDYLEAIATGEDRIEFAGGICLITDVEMIEEKQSSAK